MKAISDYVMLLLTIVASIATLVGFYQIYYQDLDDPGKYGVIFLGIIALWLLFYNVYIIAKYRHKASYADAFENINIAYTHMYELSRGENVTPQEIKAQLKIACTHVSNSLSAIKGKHVSVCIKLISKEGNGPDNAETFTLCRDEKSSVKRFVDKDKNKIHRISENCDFNYIYEHLNEGNCFYINNCIPFTYDYTNTRLKDYPQWPPRTIWGFSDILRYCYWPLDYKSTLVLPIVPLDVNKRSKDKVRGFLCIDTGELYTFNKSSDLEILKGLADGLYDKIDQLQKIT